MKLTLFWKRVIKISVTMLLILVADTGFLFASNFEKVNVADYFSGNIKKCIKNETTKTIDFDFEVKQNRTGWFYSNYEAVSTASNLVDGRFYIDYGSNLNTISINDNKDSFLCNYLGYTGLNKNTPFDASILFGSIDKNDYDTKLLMNNQNINERHCIISENIGNELAKRFDYNTLKDLIGKKISSDMFDFDLTIDAIASNFCYASNEDSYIISNYLNYNSKQTFGLKYKALDAEYTNFSFFSQLFYSSAWQAPFKNNDNSFMIINCPKNEWLVEEAEAIYYRNNIFSFSLVFSALFYFVFGFISPFVWKNDSLIEDKIIRVSLTIFLFLFFYLTTSWLVGSIYFKFHLLGKTLNIEIMKLISVVAGILGNIVCRLLFDFKFERKKKFFDSINI